MSLNVEKNYWLVFFGSFGLSGLWYNEQNQLFFTSKLLYKCYVLDWVLDGGIQTCSSWEIQLWKLSEFKKVALLGNFELSRHWCKEHKSTILLSKILLQPEIFCDANPDRRDKACCSAELYIWISRKIKMNFFWNFRTLRILMQERKTMIVYLNTRVQVLCFRLRFWWQTSNWWWLRIKSLNIERNQVK